MRKRELTELTYTKKGFMGKILGCVLESGQGSSWALGQTQRLEHYMDRPRKLFPYSLPSSELPSQQIRSLTPQSTWQNG